MTRTRNLYIGGALLTVLVALGVAQTVLQKSAAAQAKNTVQAPRFEVDPMWPKPLPNHWLLGMTIGVGVDSRDHVFIIHRGEPTLDRKEIYAAQNPPMSDCCVPAPPILEFDAEGNFVKGWGGPGEGYEWPESNHGITPDSKGNLWIGGNGANDGGGTGRAQRGGDPFEMEHRRGFEQRWLEPIRVEVARRRAAPVVEDARVSTLAELDEDPGRMIRITPYKSHVHALAADHFHDEVSELILGNRA